MGYFDGAEFGNDYEQAELDSDTHHFLMERMRADYPDWWYGLCDEWLRTFAPKVKYYVGSPEVHAAIAAQKGREFFRVASEGIPFFYPTGVATSAAEIKRGIGPIDPALRPMLLSLPEDFLWVITRNYKTVAGALLDYSAESDDGEKVSFPITVTRPWLPSQMAPDQLEASDYHDECVKMQATPAGRKAKRLLLENLTEAQAEDYFRHGMFFVRPKKKRRDGTWPLYVVERGFTNGNILSVKMSQARNLRWTLYPTRVYCYHAEEPHPIDDVLLAQKLILENEESEFLAKANPSEPAFKGRLPLHLVRRAAV